MKRFFVGILLVIFSAFFNFIHVEAKTCAEIDEQVNKYYTIKEELSSLDCTNVEDSSVVNKCNNLNLQKRNILSEIYRTNENEKQCTTQISKTEAILKENEDECGVVLGDTINKWVNLIMGAFYIIGPVLVILFGTLDFGKATISNDKEALKKASNKFFKRILALIALFLSPLLTRLIISLNTSGQYLEGDAYSCEYKNIWAKKEIKIVKVEGSNEENQTNENSSIPGSIHDWRQADKRWGNFIIGSCGTMAKCGCLLTSVSIQIANSGTAVTPLFHPGMFASNVKSNGGLGPGGGFKWEYNSWKKLAPNFRYVTKKQLNGNLSQKAQALREYLNQGYYPVAEVKAGKAHCGQHWVAVISVNGSQINIIDPSSKNYKVLNGSTYPCFASYNTTVALFKVSKN